MDIEQFWEVVAKLQERKPSVPIFNIVKAINGGYNSRIEICPTSIIEPFLNHVLNMENMCEKYKCLPFPGGYMDQPKMIMEMFEVIRGTVNHYDEYEFKMSQKNAK